MLLFKLILSALINMAIIMGLLFLPAGTWHWWRAWVLIGVNCVATVAGIAVLYRTNKELLVERLKPPLQKEQPFVDKIFVVVFIATYVGSIVFIPLDVFHFHLMGKPGTLISSLGLALYVAGLWIVTLALKQNAFAAPVVKYQAERHQTVVDTGVYGIVRHPMYAGMIPLLIGMPLWLESYAAALLTIIPLGTLAVRILIEEQFLRRELKGYDEYMKKVRYRLIPFVW